MITKPPARRTLFVAILALGVGACGSAGSDGQGTGGASGGALGAGGTTGPGGTGGSAGPGAGGSGGGGPAGTGGSPASGGAGAPGAAGTSGGGGRGAGGGAGGGGGALGGRGGGAGAGSGGAAGRTGGGGGGTGTCTASKPVNTNATGSGPHKVTVETNSGPGIDQGTIFRPADLGGTEKYPIFVWGEGGCSQDGLSNSAAMAEIASHGYFVIADGTPNGSGNRTQDRSMLAAMAAPLIAYVDWAIAENDKPCSAYYHSLDPMEVAANGFSCGGLMSQAMVLDPRIVTWGVNSSGMKGADQSYYDLIKTPVLFVEGGSGDIAYDGGQEGDAAIANLNVPVLWFSKDLGHGGDLFSARGGDFTKIDLAWLNWWLKGDETATGKGLLVGAGCPYCSNSAWEYKSAHLP
jgi:dienelactone hydrolase